MMMKLFNNIYGNKFNLIELSVDYLDDMFQYSSDDRLYEHFEFPPSENLEDKEQERKTDVRGPLDARGPFHKSWLKPMVLSKGACWICDYFEHLCLRSLRPSAVYRKISPRAI